jgi:hypothetical protein
VGPGRYKLEIVLSEEQMKKLEVARDLCRHRDPQGDLAALVEQGLNLVIAQVEKHRFAVTDRPRRTREEWMKWRSIPVLTKWLTSS